MTRALIVVDVQPTFCEGGELPVAGGNACAERIADFVASHRGMYEVVASTQDWHVDPGPHFSATPDFIDTWPPHGVAGSPNAELHPALADLDADITVRKGQDRAAYSGFEGTTEEGSTLLEALRTAGVDEVDVVGLALSHCVCDTALDAVKEGFTARVLTDLSEPVTEELGEIALGRMRQAGVILTTSDLA